MKGVICLVLRGGGKGRSRVQCASVLGKRGKKSECMYILHIHIDIYIHKNKTAM